MPQPALARRHRRLLVPLLSWLLVLCLAWAGAASGAAHGQPENFSFVVFGDTRGEPYLPGGEAQSEAIQQVLQERFQQQRGNLRFSAQGGQLESVVIPGKSGQPDTVYHYRDGWPWLVTRGDQVIMRREGRAWVYRRVIAELRRGAADPAQGASLALHTGDIELWGQQGQGLDQSPGWQDFYDNFLAGLPRPQPGRGGLFFPALGNHETWGDPEIKGVLTTLPYLGAYGLSKDRRIYALDFAGCRFIFLDSGDYKMGAGEGWYSQSPDFARQMQALTAWLREAVDQKMRQVFVVYHKPSFCISGHGPLPAGHNPHPYLKPFAQRLNITVFNGHVHTTELYQVDGVRYLLLGGGGAPQVFQADTPPAGYPRELYWQGGPRQEEYNYLLARVEGGNLSLWLHRFRPGQPGGPFQKIELFK